MDELLQQALRELPGGPAAQRVMVCHDLTSLSELADHLGLTLPELLLQLRKNTPLEARVKLHEAG
ncbi:hypothetical protein [Deinococcus wulumuqiensis]|uniref:hypothetical protein n=1 Tax=Deinococcus wulumuqiensis TaxID=980427 RepID=UPI0013C2D186|nr:hypothetical protein [Deinococcus wulumuqiensis]